MLLNKMGRPSIYLSVVMTIWGAISTATGAVQSFGGLVAVRVLLGVVESAFFPGALMILSSWYDKTLASRNSILYAGLLISSAFSGLIAAGILKMDGLGGVKVGDTFSLLKVSLCSQSHLLTLFYQITHQIPNS